MLPALAKMSKVAPLAGSVDRNLRVHHHLQQRLVAPLAGSVDRNLHFSRPDKGPLRRSPRGERG